MLPYTKSKVQSGNLGLISSPHLQDKPVDGSEDEDDPEEQAQFTNVQSVNLESGTSAASALTPPTMHTSTPSSTLSAWRSSKIKAKKDDPLEKAVTSYYERKRTEQKEQGDEADLNFFKSLLPDIKHFSSAKKRLFKRKLIELIDELSEDDLSTQSANRTSSRSSSINSFTRDNNWPTQPESTYHPGMRQEFPPSPTQQGSVVAENATPTTSDYFTNSQGWNFDHVRTEPYNYVQKPAPNLPTTTM